MGLFDMKINVSDICLKLANNIYLSQDIKLNLTIKNIINNPKGKWPSELGNIMALN